MKIKVVTILSFVVLIAVVGMKFPDQKWNDETPIYEVLKSYGEQMPSHAPKETNAEIIKRGRDLVFEGRTIGPNGKKSKFISKFYVCTSCHNPAQEDPNLKFFDPEARLDYVAANNMKFLQGSTFFGIANRETWYNDDYVLKYGALVEPASKSLAEATQLCAKVCSSGRHLEDWELEAILAFYWDNQIKLGDLELSKEEKKQILNGKKGDNKDVRDLIKSKYAQKSPATFGKTPDVHSKGYGLVGDASNGKKIYELSCQSCHQVGGVAGMILGNDKLTFQKFKRHLNKNTHYNLYEIIKHGTYAAEGKPRYMPLYPEERMSNQQVEDLKAYILQEAG
jgi:mono/diheme cytochrome c family protein